MEWIRSDMSTVRWFKVRAKGLLKSYRDGDDVAVKLVRKFTRNMTHVHLQKVQHVVAKEAGFDDWKGLVDATEEERQASIDLI